MTLPEQADRAVAQTREFLVRLCSPYGEGAIKGIRREVRAEALRLLRHYPHTYRRGDENCSDGDMGGATVHQECTLITASLECDTSVWIPVGTRLPEHLTTVLLSDGDWITTGRKVDDEWYVLECAEAQGFYEFSRLPYWMPLPSLPTD